MSSSTPEGSPPVAPDDLKTALPSRVRMVVRGLGGALVGLAVAAALMWKLDVKPREVAQHVLAAPLWVVAFSVASGFVNFALQSLRWHSVMGPLLGLRYTDAYRAQVVGFMFNQLIPMRGGDLLRVQYLGRRTGKSRATILGTEVVDRWLDFWGWIPAILVLAALSNVPSWIFKALALFGGLLSSWAITMILLTRRGYTPREGSRFAAIYASFRSGVEAFRSPRTWFIAFAIAPLPWIWEAIFISRALHGFGVELDLAKAFSVLIGFNLAMVVPSPGAIGTMETGGTAALAWFGVDHAKALAFITVYHFSQMLPGIIAGVAILVAEGENLFGKAPPAVAPSAAPES